MLKLRAEQIELGVLYLATLFLLLIYLTFISLGLPDSLLGAGWPVMHIQMDVQSSLAGLASMITAGGTIFSSFMSGRLIRRFGTGTVTTVSVALTAGALIGIAFAPSFLWLCLLAVPLGLGAGAVDAALNGFVAQHFKAHHMNWLHAFWGVGATGGPLVLSVFLANGNWRGGYRTVGLFQCSVLLILLIALPLWKKFVGSGGNAAPEAKRTVLSARQIFTLPGIWGALLFFFCYCVVEGGTGLWAASYLVNVRGFAAETAARGTSLFFAGITAGRFISGFVSMKLSARTMIRSGIGLAALGFALCAFAPWEPLAVSGLALAGTGMAPLYPSMIHETPRHFGDEASQSVIGFQMGFAYTGSTFVPPLLGIIAGRVGFGFLPYILLGIMILTLVLYGFVVRLTAKKI